MVTMAPCRDDLLARPTMNGTADHDRDGRALLCARPDLLLRAAIQQILTARYDDALRLLRQMLDREPDSIGVLGLLASTSERIGDVDGALGYFERAIEIESANPTLYSNFVFAHDRHPGRTMEQAHHIRRRYNAMVARPCGPHANSRDPNRTIRLGYVSADFHHHSAAFGFAPLLLNHDEQFELYAYDNAPTRDPLNEQLREKFTAWREVKGLSDDELEARIREDRIDILVDLSGHSAGNRLPVFARKPAPVQVTMIGYLTGTGLDAMDYLFADPEIIRPDEERWYAEKIVRLPRCMTYLAASPDDVGAPSVAPCAERGYLTFGVYQRFGKLKTETIALWSRVLAAVPDARLVIKAPGLEGERLRIVLEQRFAEAGCDLTRLTFVGASGHFPHMRAYELIDVALDPWPDGGGISTLEAAWMGVPTLTLPHHQISSRVTASVNAELGLDVLTVETADEYVQRAVWLSTQLEHVAALRAILRDLMTVSAFCNPAVFMPPLENAYRDMWQRWCRDHAAPADAPALHLV